MRMKFTIGILFGIVTSVALRTVTTPSNSTSSISGTLNSGSSDRRGTTVPEATAIPVVEMVERTRNSGSAGPLYDQNGRIISPHPRLAVPTAPQVRPMQRDRNEQTCNCRSCCEGLTNDECKLNCVACCCVTAACVGLGLGLGPHCCFPPIGG